MVVPVCGQSDWALQLSDLPVFQPGPEPMVVISPHPDDETLAIGGLLFAQREKGIPVLLIAVTDGENAYADSPGLGELRREEQNNAARCLGIESKDILPLHITDSSVKAGQQYIVEQLTPLVSSHTHILAPWPRDFHPDHEACGETALQLARAAGARLTFYLFWTWHRGTPALLEGCDLHAFPLNAAQQAAKAEALAFHESQLRHHSGDPVLHDIHLWPALLPFEVYLPA